MTTTHAITTSNKEIEKKIREEISENVLETLYYYSCGDFNDHMDSLNWEEVFGKSYAQLLKDGDIERHHP